MTIRRPYVAMQYSQLPHSRWSSQATGTVRRLRHPVAKQLGGLASLLVLVSLHGSWSAQLLLVPLLLILPGVILLRALRVPGAAIAQQPIYVPSASILVLTFTALATDLIGLAIGVSRPLRTAPMLAGLELVCLILLALSIKAPEETQIPWHLVRRPVSRVWPAAVPLVGAVGALRLNSGHTNHIAVIAVVITLILLVGTFLRAPWLDESLLVVIIYAASLAMMWSFSLRGDMLYGFDITSEYNALQQTVVTGTWHLSHPNDAYGAMLSLTVFPAILHAFTGMSGLLVLKVVYPAIGALFPVAVYSFARRVLGSRWAFLAAALVVMQYTFFQQFPALARQEIGTLLFAALISAALDAELAPRTRWVFVILLSAGMVLSHYSTTYLAIPLLGIAVILQFILSWFRPLARVGGGLALAFCMSLLGAVIWYGPITHSASNVAGFVSTAEQQGINFLPNRSGNLLTTWLQGESTRSLTPAEYQKYIAAYYRARKQYVVPMPDAGRARYAVQSASVTQSSARWPFVAGAANLAAVIIQQLINLLAIAGVMVIALHRKVPAVTRQVGVLGMAATVILMLTRVSGTIAQEYNPQRAFLQSMIVLGVGICWLFQRMGARWQRTRWPILAAGVLSVGTFFSASSGLTAVILGEGTATNLANRFDDYQEFYTTAPEIASARWLSVAAPPASIIDADHYGQLRLFTVGISAASVLNDLTPLTIDHHAWVYASRTNILNGIARSSGASYSAVYAFPVRFLSDNFDIVYTNGTSEVFHR